MCTAGPRVSLTITIVTAPLLFLPSSYYLLLPCSCSCHAPDPIRFLPSYYPGPPLAPALLLLLPCSYPAHSPALLLPSSCPTPPFPTPALLLSTCSCPDSALFLLLPCSCPASATPVPAPASALLLPCSCSCPPTFGSLHHHRYLMTFFANARPAFWAADPKGTIEQRGKFRPSERANERENQ